MMLKKIVEEYETIKGNLKKAQKLYGEHSDHVSEYQNQLDNLCIRYFGSKPTNKHMNSNR
ncbi:hypothetical protein [Gottfriedia acidiceleris]|uniref:Uncharacterized protein n=1 Tax=Gottfriedia acidiceleris TaxID=371036 RepID=A0ABY4JQS7_9BACI|nr:hypothetical protein [Gottfriedia acidiceleris]UPM55218.1 hypothetical protein MY490_05095 [Gottfriedia acidiceleris]